MGLEGIMLSEINQRNKYCIISFTHGIKKKQAHQYRKQISSCWRWIVGVGKMGEGGQKVQTSWYKINKTWGCNVQHGHYG